MKLLSLATAAAFLCCSGIALAQAPFPVLSEKDVPGLRMLSEAYYDGNSLWGYIDGGADVYLEYGFSKLLSRKAELGGVRYQIDMYRMQNRASAFGIFSISAFTCSHPDSLPGRHCISRYQVQAARGDYYLSIVNDKGTESAGRINVAIARRLLSRIDPADDQLPAVFGLPEFHEYARSVKFIRGKLGMENGYPAWEGLFAEDAAYSLYLLPVRSDSVEMTLAHVVFDSKAEADKFVTQAGFDTLATSGRQRRDFEETTRCLWRNAPDSLVYLDIKTTLRRAESIIGMIDQFLRRR